MPSILRGFQFREKNFLRRITGRMNSSSTARGLTSRFPKSQYFRIPGTKWADPEFLDLSIGGRITPNSVAAAAQNILCHTELHAPLVKKDELAAMNFKSLSSTSAGDGEMFYSHV